jgi:hypothetical protein
MTDLDLMTDEEIVSILQDRMRAKEVAYLFAWGVDSGDTYAIVSELDFEHLQTIYENCMEDFENELYNSDNWNPTDEELLQWEADTEEDEEGLTS